MREWQDEQLVPSASLDWEIISQAGDDGDGSQDPDHTAELRQLIELYYNTRGMSKVCPPLAETFPLTRRLSTSMQMNGDSVSWSSLQEQTESPLASPLLHEGEEEEVDEHNLSHSACEKEEEQPITWWERISKESAHYYGTEEWSLSMPPHSGRGLMMLVASNVAVFALGFLLGRRSAPPTPFIQIISI